MLMKKGAKKLVGTKDFQLLELQAVDAKSPIKTIKTCKIKIIKK